MTSDDERWDPKDAYTTLAANLEQPHKFAEIFCAAAKDNKKIDGVLRENIKELIKQDHETRENIKALVNEIEKEAFRAWLRKSGAWWYGVSAVALGMLIQALIRKFIG